MSAMLLLRGFSVLWCSAQVVAYSCGERKVKNRQLLTNGYNTQLGDYPWHAAINQLKPSKNYICGGTLVNDQAILTSAHCVTQPGKTVPRAKQELEVQLGKYTVHDDSDRVRTFKLSRVIAHPQFTHGTNQNDLAVLITVQKVPFGTYIQPACLPMQPMLGPKVIGVTVGWGYTEQHQVAEVLRAVSAPVVSHLKCVESNPVAYGTSVTAKSFCAGWRNGSNPCNGDSGGGFFVNHGGVWTLLGIVSFTAASEKYENVCSITDYTVFVDVAKYRPWILAKITRTDAPQLDTCNQPVGPKRYLVHNNGNVTFLQAWRLCLNGGHRLATITSDEDSRLLEQTLRQSNNPRGPWWIAGTDLGSEGHFLWISGNSPVGHLTGYTNYAPGQPDNADGAEHCLEVGRAGGITWNDAPCHLRQRYICEHFG